MNHQNVKIGKKGKILTGKHAGWYVLVEDDSSNTGGYLILTSSDVTFKRGEGFDSWVENVEQIEHFLKSAEWKIDWLE
jgi:hypothetical protein